MIHSETPTLIREEKKRWLLIGFSLRTYKEFVACLNGLFTDGQRKGYSPTLSPQVEGCTFHVPM